MKKTKRKSKKGELTTKQLVTIIILIVSFIIVLFLLFRLNLGETTDKEICRNSVILKDKSAFSGPLDCKTNYLCISGGADCEDISQTSKTDINPEDEEEIMKAIADEMADCWWQFGEGKVDYIKGIDIVGNNACAICSRISFEESFGSVSEISYTQFYNYLETTQKTSSQTYLQYLYSVSNLDSIVFGEESGYLDKEINFGEDYLVVTGISKEGILPRIWSHLQSSVTFGILDGSEEEEKAKRIIPVTLLKTSEIDELECDEFVTKA